MAAMEKNSGATTIAAAFIVGIALIVSGLIVKDSLDSTVEELVGVREAIEAGVGPSAKPDRQAAAPQFRHRTGRGHSQEGRQGQNLEEEMTTNA